MCNYSCMPSILKQTLKLAASTMDNQQVMPLHIAQWMQSYAHALIWVAPSLIGLIYDLSAPDQLVSVSEQLAKVFRSR